MTDKLYGFEGDEFLESSPEAVYEKWESDHDFPDCLHYPSPGDLPRAFEEGRLEIEEWSAVPVASVLPSGADIADDIVERLGDDWGFHEAADQAVHAANRPDVVAAFQSARDLLASHIHFLVADRKLRTLIVTWDENNEPLLDGEPMYRKAEG